MYGDLNLDLLDLSKVESCVDRVNMFIYLTNVYGAPKESELIDKFIDIFYDIIRNGNFRTSNKNDLNSLWDSTFNDAIYYHKAAYENFGWYFYRQLSLDSRGMSKEELKDYILNFKESNLNENLLKDFKKDDEVYEIQRMRERYTYCRPFKENNIKVYLSDKLIELDLYSNTLKYKDKKYTNVVDAMTDIFEEKKIECRLSNYKNVIANSYFLYKGNKFELYDLYKIVYKCSTHNVMGGIYLKFNDKEIFVPEDKAEEMINGLSDEVFNPSAKFLDSYNTNGVLLLKIRDRLMKSPLMMKGGLRDPKKRLNYILENQLYALASSKLARAITIRALYGKLTDRDNIKYSKSRDIQKEFNGMIFDVIVGNPPYNNGMDLDFVNQGYEAASKYVCMITPAKWQTADGNQKIASDMTYGEFRKKIVPHMKHACFYPDCLDVFGIQESSGITWFIVDKNKTYINNCTVENKCNLQKYVNGVEIRDITHGQSLWNIGNEIVNYMGEYEKFDIEESISNARDRKAYTLNMNTQLTKATGSSGVWDWDLSRIKPECIGKGGVFFNNKGSLVLTSGMKFLKGDEKSKSSTSKDVFTSDDMDECKSFNSWIDTKFTRFFMVINVSKLTILDNHVWRFVPAPPSGKFDHIYTDKELYEAFNLPQKYIDVIESVIKERK